MFRLPLNSTSSWHSALDVWIPACSKYAFAVGAVTVGADTVGAVAMGAVAVSAHLHLEGITDLLILKYSLYIELHEFGGRSKVFEWLWWIIK